MSEEKIIDIGNFSIYRKRYRNRNFIDKSKDECEHLSLELDDHGEIVRCKGCNQQVSAFWAIKKLSEYFRNLAIILDDKRKEIEEAKKHNFHLMQAKNIESIWRSKMAVLCPHCHRGILATDNLSASMSREIELKIRQDKIIDSK